MISIPSNSTECDSVKAISNYVMNWISKQSDVGEESLTDWLLCAISEKIQRVTYKAFTRHQEANLTGADWEWWFLYPQKAYKLLVQAKKLRTSNYSYINRKTKKSGVRQIDRLINYSKSHNFLPLYVFYTNNNNVNKCCKNSTNTDGIIITNSFYIDNLIKQRKNKSITEQDILIASLPLSCFFCCNDANIDFSRFILPFAPSDNPKLGEYDRIPFYVQEILREGNRDIPKDLKRIVIVDKRE